MTYTKANIQDFLAQIAPFNQLSSAAFTKLLAVVKPLRFRMGQTISIREEMPAEIAIIYEGQGRLLGYEPDNPLPATLQLLQPGEVVGWVSLLRDVSCETVIASVETVCLTISARDFLDLMQESTVYDYFANKISLIEIFDILVSELSQRANSGVVFANTNTQDLADLTLKVASEAVIRTLTSGKRLPVTQLDVRYDWFVSGGNVNDLSLYNRVITEDIKHLQVTAAKSARIIGFPKSIFNPCDYINKNEIVNTVNDFVDIPYAPERTKNKNKNQAKNQTKGRNYPFVGGKNPLNATLACFQMLSQYWHMPFRRDVISRVLDNQVERTQALSLQLCGAIAELMGLNAQLINVSAFAICRLQAPAMIRWQNSFAILYEMSEQEIVIAVPETGIIRRKLTEFIQHWGDEGQVLLLAPSKHTPKQKFSLRWFLPALKTHRKVLLEVLVASFFVKLFSLANPLIVQIIIDKVIIQKSLDTLNVLGILLLVVAMFEALLTSLRTYLFVDTTNRIDLALGSEIIDHLLRLPLRYFERRPVGELATRANELEKIRSFLTGTALTVVLDAIFSVIYIVVMLIYSWQLTIVALVTVPLFALLTMFVSPMVRRQLRTQAEHNAQTQSYLVEVLSGIQTVKAQNIELRARWQWQELYSRYVATGFKTVVTSTTASSTSNFLNQVSSLLVLWAGAYFALTGELGLGELIAFRIIASYVTSPLLRLTQVWQTFQETALSLERLSDILDTPPEADETDRQNIAMPMIMGAVKYENLCFRFAETGPLQLNNIDLEFTPGSFIGVVGQSGSGKSTLTKLLARLYQPASGRILIDGYDINKVELYSLRRQIGVVLQDTLLFDGTVQENIALTNPEATTEEIVAAAKIAVAHEFIMSLPNGYNTRVGERGSALSGGQRQRIAIARSILQNPRLLILDEATSALDYESERQVCLNLAEAFRGRTVFFITHRLTTIRNADVILLLDKGSVVEQGVHEELIAQKGRYYCLYQQQELTAS